MSFRAIHTRIKAGQEQTKMYNGCVYERYCHRLFHIDILDTFRIRVDDEAVCNITTGRLWMRPENSTRLLFITPRGNLQYLANKHEKKQGKNFLEKQWKMNESFGSHRGHTNTSILTKKNYTVCPCLVLSSSFCLLATKGFIENVIVLLNDDEEQLDRKWYFILARMFHISHTWVTMSVERNKQKNISLTMNLESIRNTIWTFTRLILVIE